MKNLKRVFVLFLTAAFLLNYTNTYANTENSLYKDYIPEEAYSYAAENYRDGLGVILDNVKLYGIRGKIEDFQLCDPYIVYDVEKEVQEPLYYFPIKNNQEKIVLVMAVFLTENGWSDSISGCMADELNDKNYLEEECLIYGDSDEICVENEDICWAASVATIYNYIKVNSTLDYDRIRSKLKEKKPISMATRTANNAYGHLVTLVGLDLGERNQPRITIWNSATEQYECMAYLGDNTAYGLFSDTYY